MGSGFRTWASSEVVTASHVQNYLQDQTVMVFASASARTSAISSPEEGMVTYLKDSDGLFVYDGASWDQVFGLGGTVGTDGAGVDVTFYSGTSGDYLLWDASEEKLILEGTHSATVLDVTDGNVVIADGTLTVGSAGAGEDVTFYSDTSGDQFVWDSSAEKLTITGTNATTALDVADGNVTISDTCTAGAFSGPLTGNVTGNASGSSGSCTGLAATATALATGRTIGGVSFDGTANIAVTLAATATALATARTIGGTSFDGTGNIVPATITVADTTDTSCSVALWESATGDLAPKSDGGLTYNAGTGTLTATAFAGPLTGNVTGNASGSSGSCTGLAATATALATGRTIGGTSFDGTANIAVALAAEATALETARTIGGVSFDGTANIAVTLAATATALATARTINGVSFDGTANVTVTAAAGTLSGSTLASGVTASSLTSVGTLASATITGDLIVDTSTLKVDSSNNRVGIGTAAPGDVLHVADAATTISGTQIWAEGRYGGYGAGISFMAATSNGGTLVEMARITGDGEASWDTTAGNQDAGMRFFTTLNGTSAEKMRITAGGVVNASALHGGIINYTNWAPNFQVQAPVHIKNWTGTAGSPVEYYDWPTALLNLSTASNYSWNSMIQFGMSNDIGYNTNLDLYWHISLYDSGDAAVTSTSDSTIDLAIMGPGEFSIRTASADRLRIDTTGLLTSPRSYSATTGNAANLWVDTDGSFYRSTAGSIRLKTDVEDAADSFADAVLNLRPVWYRSLGTADRRDWSHWGLVAEEVAEIDPRLVEWGWTPVEDADGNQVEIVTEAVEAAAATYDEDGNELTPKVHPTAPDVELVWELDADGEKVLRPDGVQYTKIVPLLINLIKRQDSRITALEAA